MSEGIWRRLGKLQRQTFKALTLTPGAPEYNWLDHSHLIFKIMGELNQAMRNVSRSAKMDFTNWQTLIWPKKFAWLWHDTLTKLIDIVDIRYVSYVWQVWHILNRVCKCFCKAPQYIDTIPMSRYVNTISWVLLCFHTFPNTITS
jgi:hypothetical protein